MSVFAIIAIAMTVAALLCVVLPLARRGRFNDGPSDIAGTNLAILRDQLSELEADLARGAISASQYDGARADLERRVLEEGPDSPRSPARSAGRWPAWALAVLIPPAALSMYAWIGEPAGLLREGVSADRPVAPEEIEKMVAGLAQRLEKNPDDPRGWMMLARSYYVLQRMPEAAAAYAKSVELVKDDADLYADYADAMAMSLDRRIEGKTLELVMQALRIDPSQPKALAMAGTGAFNRKDFRGAIGYWEKLLPLLPPDSEMAKSVAGGIAEAQEQAKAARDAAPAGRIGGRVSLSPALAAQVGPQDTLFIVARAVSGPRIPLAVVRKHVADLPLEFVLDDTQAMSPELKLSAFAEVVVTARISKSGNALSQPGDLQGQSPAVKVGARGIAIVIDKAVP